MGNKEKKSYKYKIYILSITSKAKFSFLLLIDDVVSTEGERVLIDHVLGRLFVNNKLADITGFSSHLLDTLYILYLALYMALYGLYMALHGLYVALN